MPGPGGASMQRDFGFHACLGPDTSQGDVMALCGIQQLLDAALAGYPVPILAYGQTGGCGGAPYGTCAPVVEAGAFRCLCDKQA